MIVGVVTEVAIFYVSEYDELPVSIVPHDALTLAGKNRMCPIAMTTCATGNPGRLATAAANRSAGYSNEGEHKDNENEDRSFSVAATFQNCNVCERLWSCWCCLLLVAAGG